MRFTTCVVALIGLLVWPPVATGEGVEHLQHRLLQAGLAEVQRMSMDPVQSQVMGAQGQQTKLKTDRKTTIILISVVAVAVLVYIAAQDFSGITIR